MRARVAPDLFDHGRQGTAYLLLDNNQHFAAALASAQNEVSQNCVPALKDTTREMYLVTELDSNDLMN
jgi:hypothetical protein